VLALNVVGYFFGSFLEGGDYNGVDMLLCFFGYYAQDLFRVGAVNLYFYLSITSILVDSSVLIVLAIISYQRDHNTIWAIVISLMIWAVETGVKVGTTYYARKLYKHLIAVPGQSIN